MKPGDAPDTVVAAALGITRQAVQARRKREGIPPFKRPRRALPEPIAAVVGAVPDEDAAAALGVTKQAVAARRKRHGIPPAIRPRYTPEQLAILDSNRPLEEKARTLKRSIDAVRRQIARRRSAAG